MHAEISGVAGIAIAGVLSSLGPCVAPRLLALAGTVSGAPPIRAAGIATSFVAGLAVTNCALAEGGALCARALQFSGLLYAAIALALAVAGISALWRMGGDAHAGCAVRGRRTGFGAAAFMGASSGFVLSPCCSSLLLLASSAAAQSGGARAAAVLALAFTAGHALPLFAFAGGAGALCAMLRRPELHAAVSVTSAALTLALAGYYAVLA